MPRGRFRGPLDIDLNEQADLVSIVRTHTAPAALVRRANIVLMCGEGKTHASIAKALRVNLATVGKWRARYEAEGIDGLKDRPRPGKPRKVNLDIIAEIADRTLHTKPPVGDAWTCRSMAEAAGVSKDTVNRIWRDLHIQPHRFRYFKLSKDKHFVRKVVDVVGLYLNPPDNAMVLCVDEKSQIQALERTAPMLPLGFGYVEGVTHNYKRHGVTTLFAALDVASGQVLAQCKPQHRHQEFLSFLRHIDANVPKDLDIHIVVDNYGSHRHRKVQRWFERRPRYHLHFIPSYSSWMNQVEIWFGIITRQAIRRGSFGSKRELVDRIMRFVDDHNQKARPFKWTATASSIIAKVERIQRLFNETSY